MGARRVLRYVLRMRKRFLFACPVEDCDTHTHTQTHKDTYVAVCVRQGERQGGGQTSSIQKQMEKVMIICLANAAQSGRAGSYKEGVAGGVAGGRGEDETRRAAWPGHCLPVAHLIAVHK